MATVLFPVYDLAGLELGRQLQMRPHLEVVRAAGGRRLVGVCAGVLARGGPGTGATSRPGMTERAISPRPLWALLYLACNLAMAVAVLAPVGAPATRR